MVAYASAASSYHAGVLVTSVVLSFGLGLTVWWLASGYRGRMRLRSRVVLVRFVKQVVDDWEEFCLREVEHWLAVRSPEGNIGEDSLFSNHGAKERGEVQDALPFHGPMRSMAYAPGVDLSRWLQLWNVGRRLCAALPEDMVLLERLGYIIKYTAFRRLATMAEARYYAAAWRSAVHGSDTKNGKAQIRRPRIPPWLVGHRPFWIVPLPGPGVGQFLCLPLSYFPVEAVLTSGAEETWVKDLADVLPLIMGQLSFKFLVDGLRTRQARRVAHATIRRRYPPSWKRLWREIDRLFNTFAAPLAKSQLERGRMARQRFCREKLYEGVELVSGDGPDMEEGMDGIFSVQSSEKVEGVMGRDVLLRDANLTRKLTLLLRFRTLSHAVRIAINLWAPRYNVFAGWMLPYVLSSSGCLEGRGAVLMDFARSVLWGSISAAVGAAVRSFDDVFRWKILVMLRDEVLHEVNVKIAVADEAFLRRCSSEGVGRSGGNPLARSFEYAENTAARMLGYFDCEQKKYISLIIGVVTAMLRQEVDVAAFAAAASWLNFYEISRAIGRWCGLLLDKSVEHEIARMGEEPLPAEPRYGLQLLLEVLAEENDGTTGTNAPVEGDAPVQNGSRASHSRYFLSLIACGGTFHVDWPVGPLPTHKKAQTDEVAYLRRLQKLFDTVVSGERACALSCTSFICSPNDGALSIARGLRENAACVREFVLKERVQHALEGDTVQTVPANSSEKLHAVNGGAKAALDAEEAALLARPQAMNRIPSTLGFDDVFSRPPRFILRQLGLDTVFAQRAALSVRRAESFTITMDLSDPISRPFHNVFTQLLLHLTEFIETLLFYSLLSYRSNLTSIWGVWPTWFTTRWACDGGATIAAEWSAASLLDRVSAYRALMRGNERVELDHPFRLTQQVARYMPTFVHDASPHNYSAVFKARRGLWRNKIKHVEGIQFDDAGRISEGFHLRKGIDFRGVWFVYPELHHCATDGSLQPSLANVTVHFPATQITAILGRTGSGKSTLLSLLKRMYDPVAVVSLKEERVWEESEGLITVLQRCLGTQLPQANEGNCENIVTIDDIPLTCFSTTFLRQAVGMLEQTPFTFKGLSFLQNISLFTPRVSRDECVAAATLCRCKEFIESRPLGYDDKSKELSTGEKQRLALARAILVGRHGLGVCLLDEPTSHLDGHTAAYVEEAIGNLTTIQQPEVTVLLVSHRLSTIRYATHVVILDGGQLEYQGPADERKLRSNSFLRSAAEGQDLQIVRSAARPEGRTQGNVKSAVYADGLLKVSSVDA
ncbi:ABC transporter, putative [Trypanosoma brucei gambiense DAL972]|uniref:ABC transporter, putative n=1 Tax=Trypanosoma brucei gambiense (strain MHOM/CI/86/DAL972) TaxID=679716 RepID=C9ZJQ1_TRYB9|nr:ABC transporter, putative [Trypanosoma brucei gambiense DAL972]CBH09611.1 ABC transporter, putative [Trypanosoma brucei gambiense DAL972]|eukprot:XP_011771915.1 ABC transporter, putative [Trypanosoma brucei gambiense DAL972]